jgi:hypothetical protein
LTIASALIWASAWIVRVGLWPLIVGKVELPMAGQEIAARHPLFAHVVSSVFLPDCPTYAH